MCKTKPAVPPWHVKERSTSYPWTFKKIEGLFSFFHANIPKLKCIRLTSLVSVEVRRTQDSQIKRHVISYKLLLANITTTKPTITNASSPPDFTRSSGEIQTNSDNSFITAGILNKTGGFEKKIEQVVHRLPLQTVGNVGLGSRISMCKSMLKFTGQLVFVNF